MRIEKSTYLKILWTPSVSGPAWSAIFAVGAVEKVFRIEGMADGILGGAEAQMSSGRDATCRRKDVLANKYLLVGLIPLIEMCRSEPILLVNVFEATLSTRWRSCSKTFIRLRQKVGRVEDLELLLLKIDTRIVGRDGAGSVWKAQVQIVSLSVVNYK